MLPAPWQQPDFPNLTDGSYEKKSPVDGDYNCIAWAVEEDDRWWWPVPSPFAYWPPGLPRVVTLDNFIVAFGILEYEPADNDLLEAGFEKVAIYADATGTPTHMARRRETGAWTSKLGPQEDIDHDTLEDLEGGVYGHVPQIIKRPLKQGE
jgi:hypothetical protein